MKSKKAVPIGTALLPCVDFGVLSGLWMKDGAGEDFCLNSARYRDRRFLLLHNLLLHQNKRRATDREANLPSERLTA